jgi:hypothetical protein
MTVRYWDSSSFAEVQAIQHALEADESGYGDLVEAVRWRSG